MKDQGLFSWGLARRAALVVTVAASFVLAGAGRASAQEGQGKYVTQAAARLVNLIDKANREGYKLHDNVFSIGGGWLKQDENNWVALFTVELKAGAQYRFLGAGDNDAKDVDLEVRFNDKVVAVDTRTDPTAVVSYSPTTTGRYLVRLRLYASDQDLPCVCLGIVMAK
ncbi:MAG: hypothetical protein L0Y71_14925 [Gemmataceae bacterium]|nr:hypothetical protein [Gemmataceae bacterium]